MEPNQASAADTTPAPAAPAQVDPNQEARKELFSKMQRISQIVNEGNALMNGDDTAEAGIARAKIVEFQDWANRAIMAQLMKLQPMALAPVPDPNAPTAPAPAANCT